MWVREMGSMKRANSVLLASMSDFCKPMLGDVRGGDRALAFKTQATLMLALSITLVYRIVYDSSFAYICYVSTQYRSLIFFS